VTLGMLLLQSYRIALRWSGRALPE
jgi:hypothetical protein